jgi:hypothetical protein
MPQKLIDVNEFMQLLQDKNLVIVSSAEFEAGNILKLEAKRKQYLKRTSLTFKEVLELKLLPITSKQGIENWIATGKIKSDEVFVSSSGKRMILVSALKRLEYF